MAVDDIIKRQLKSSGLNPDATGLFGNFMPDVSMPASWSAGKDPLAGLRFLSGGLIPQLPGTLAKKTPSVMPPSTEWSDMQDMEGGMALRNASPIVPASSPAPISGGGGLIPSPGVVAPPAKNASDLAREDAMNEWRVHQEAIASGLKPSDAGFGLSPLFFAKHPEVSGGVFVGPNGPQFLFAENKPPDIMSQAKKLIGDFSDRILSGQAEKEGRVGQYTDEIGALLNQLASLTQANTGASKAPSEIAQNQANANRATVVNVPTGPESQTGAFSLIPGQPPQQFASGTPAIPEKNTITGMINQGYLEFMKESAKIDSDPLIPPDQKNVAHASLQARFRDYFNGLQQMASKGGNQPSESGGKTPLKPGQRVKQNPSDGKYYIVDEKTNKVVGEWK